MTVRDGIEIEVKFRIDDPGMMAGKIQDMGAKLVFSGLEISTRYDRNGELGRNKELLRLRYGGCPANITHKRGTKNAPKGFKVREETVIQIDSAEDGKKLLDALGFKPVWTYEKNRQIWILDGVELFLDTVPLLGNFMEIEGSPGEIRMTAKKLGLDMKDAIAKGYYTVYSDYIKEKRLPKQDLIFPEGKR